MLTSYVHILTTALWIAVIAVITTGILRALCILIRSGTSGTFAARQRVASAIIGGLGLSTAIALLATTRLRSWNAIGMFAAAASLRTFVKFVEQRVLRSRPPA